MPITALRPTLLGALTPALALLLSLAAPGVHALGLGRPQVQSALGRPLDVTFPLLLAEGEQLADGCARAEVIAGDARVPAGLLQVRLEGEPGQRRVRLTSQVGIDEPALRITLALGCPLVLTREFNAFIDPPGGASQAAAPAPAPAYTPPPLVETARLEVQLPAPKPRLRPKPRVSGPRLTLEQPEILTSAAARPARPAASAVTELTPELEAQITQLEQTVAQLRAEILARQQAEGGAASAPEATLPASTVASAPDAAAASAAASAPAPEAFRVTPALAPAPRQSS
jgi:pilus assembly protein FimV